ncbi:uncharacterized protein [Apostichopus japonicus]|uniref:uncharacterized protein isoform X1 n=1 Tax=Stichopus japonicus TaxID=307972 RepID=UPI003AB10F3D
MIRVKLIKAYFLCLALSFNLIFEQSSGISSSCSRKDKIKMTVMSFMSQDSASFISEPHPHFECYLGVPDGDAAVSAVRGYDTRSLRKDENLRDYEPLVDDMLISGLPSSNVTGFNVSLIPVKNNTFGVYNCTAVKADREDTTIMVIFLHADPYVVPVDGQHTQTVNDGDLGVVLDMEWSFTGVGPRWRVNESSSIDTNEDYDIISNRGARAEDNGLYEGHPSLYRNDGRHVLRRLIVRDCKSGKWGAPGCTGICDNCYNGGVCDDETGKCICPPGFMGPNCLSACGPNKFGYSCEFECVKGGSDDGCQGRQFCLVDPFGCRCNTGFKNLSCSVSCDPNKYGAGCLQDCHCQNESSCDRFTGECDSKGCLAGWNGNNCQIPDDCMDGYYGSQCTSKCLCYMDAPCDKTTGRCPDDMCSPGSVLDTTTQTCQSCSAGLFGDSCTRECHCESDACDSVTGECVGCCKRQWLDGTNLRCQEGILNVTGNIVNPGVKWSSVTCWSRELTGNSTRYPVNLVRSLVSHDDSGVTLSNRSDSQSDDFTLRGWNYTIDNPQAGDQFYCRIPMSTAQLNATLSYYELLVLSNPPELLDVTSTSIDIRWAAWEEEIDVGDPPLVGYVVHIKEASSTLWTNRSVIINSLEYRLIHLEHDTNYTVSVSAVREGEMGEGPRGPPITVKTLCQVPTITPTNITATVTDINHLNITWQIDDNNITCSTGIHSYTIYYKIENSGEEPIQLRVVPASTTWTIITEGLVPGLTYIFLVSLTTDLESSLGEASMAVTFPMPQSSGRDSPVGFIIIPVIIVLILFVFIISFIIYRRRKKANVLPPGQVQSFYNNDVRIDDETRVQDNINSLEMRTSYEKPGGSQTAGYEEDITKKSDEAGFDYEVPNEIRKPATSEITDHATDYDNATPDDIEKSTGIYINIPTNKKTSPPRPIAISEFQSFMRRGKRSLITDVVKEFLALPMGQQYPCSEALRYEAMQNKSSHQIVPYDHSRVKLQTGRNYTRSDYYNASNIKAWGHGKTSFIAAKDPQSRIDSERFWRMILQQGVRTIVMLTDISNTDICYWPKKDSTKEVFGEMTVLLQDQSVYPHYTIRTLNAFRDNGDTILTVHQLQFHGWTHTGVPNDISNLVAFINQVKVSETSSKARPLLVHCRNGCGATGTFIALYILMDQMKENNTVSVYNVIRNLRKDRMDMVLTKLQYWFIYETLQEAQLMPNQSSLTADEMKGLEDQSLQDKAEREFKALSKIEEFHESPESLIGRAEVNSHKNRYPDIIPSDLCRPILKSEGITLGSNDYINATNVPENGLILTQAPMTSILEDFWRLVYDNKCSRIIMLNEIQKPDKASSATKYWPDAGNIPFGSMNVDCTNTSKQDDYSKRQFSVSHQSSEESVSVEHLAFHGSPKKDEDIPKLIDFFIHLTENKMSGKTIVHCINGVSLSAVYAVAMAQMESLNTYGTCDVYLCVRRLRKINPNLILTQNDYILCLKLLRSYLDNQTNYYSQIK